MTYLPRTIIALSILLFPVGAFAYIIPTDYQPPQTYERSSSSSSSSDSSVSSVSSESSSSSTSTLSTGSATVLADQVDALDWSEYRSATKTFWASMMNGRRAAKAFREQAELRRQKHIEKRISCKEDIRRANRDSIQLTTFSCFRALLTIDLESLRKEKQFIEEVVGVSDTYRSAALFHITNLMDAVSTVIQAIDVGVYGSTDGLLEAKKNLNMTYRANRRLALAHLRVDRAIMWVRHLMVRLRNVQDANLPPEEVSTKIDESILCLRDVEEVLLGLLSQEDIEALIQEYSQVQSDIKFCNDLALEAQRLNTEFEQEEAKNEEPSS